MFLIAKAKCDQCVGVVVN